jgi:hypothetical protein
MHRGNAWRALLVATLTALIFVSGTGVATAASAGPVEDSSYSEAQKSAAETKAAAETAKRTCELFLKGLLARGQGRCEEAMKSKFTREAVPVLAATAMCASMPSAAVKGVCAAVVASQADKVKGWFWDAYKVALGAAEDVVKVVTFIANPTHALDYFMNDAKGDAIGLFKGVMDEAMKSVSFDAGAAWWRQAYAATASIGLVVLGGMMLLTLSQASSGKIGPEAARSSMGHSLVGMLMLSMGPPVAWAIGNLSNGMSEGIIEWMGPDVVSFLAQVPLFAALTSAMTGGVVMGLVIWGGLFVGSLGIMGTFLVQNLSTYVLGAVMGIAWGMTGNPRWRTKAMRLPMMWVGLVLAKPAMLLVLGIVVKMSNALIFASAGGVMQTVINALTIIIAIIFVAVAPWTLLKWFPLLPDGGDSVTSSGPVGTNAAMGMAGSGASGAAMNRARTASNESSSSRTSSAQSPAPSPKSSAPKAGPGPGQGAQQSGAPALSSATAGGTRAAGAAKTAGGAGKTAAGAGAGAATGGALLMAQLAAQAGQAAITKAREAASGAAPETRGEA